MPACPFGKVWKLSALRLRIIANKKTKLLPAMKNGGRHLTRLLDVERSITPVYRKLMPRAGKCPRPLTRSSGAKWGSS